MGSNGARQMQSAAIRPSDLQLRGPKSNHGNETGETYIVMLTAHKCKWYVNYPKPSPGVFNKTVMHCKLTLTVPTVMKRCLSVSVLKQTWWHYRETPMLLWSGFSENYSQAPLKRLHI